MHLLTKGTLFKTGGLEPKMILSAIGFVQLRIKVVTFKVLAARNYQKIFIRNVPFLYKHQAFYFRCKMFLLKEMK